MINPARLALIDSVLIIILTLPISLALHAAVIHADHTAEARLILLLLVSILILARIQPSAYFTRHIISRGRGWYSLLILASILTLLPFIFMLIDTLFNTTLFRTLLSLEVKEV